MDVNCCPRNDFSFPMKNSTKEVTSSWPATYNGTAFISIGQNEQDHSKPLPVFNDFVLRNTSNLIDFSSQQLPSSQLLNQNHLSSFPLSDYNHSTLLQPLSALTIDSITSTFPQNNENIRHWIGDPFLNGEQQQITPPLTSTTQTPATLAATLNFDSDAENIRHWIGDFTNETTLTSTTSDSNASGINQIPLLSQKVFIGGVPRFATEIDIHANFERFGTFEIQWPKLHGNKEQHRENGFFHIVFHNARSVCTLLDNCSRHQNNTSVADYFIHFETATGSRKTVEVIPWNIGDNNYALRPPQQLDSKKTIFVGNLHGTMTARSLWRLMEDLFGGAVYAGVDIDKYKYPIGSGRVTFDNSSSFLHAVSTAFVDVRTPRFLKRLQIEPHLQYRFCSLCKTAAGDLFCRNFACFDYFCLKCWQKIHSQSIVMASHKAVTRHSKSSQPIFHPMQTMLSQTIN
ncbi:unnamed protein product [Didymodactylos carnosus]|uniref:RRM domain-containing protein n=1 Tax=Didymodactylos carnosus TaxID=1234261 RepID=A0A813SBG1_9BILA|nr:unnamed protein product [Didymodactylos carnosus]CAF0797345.1 unnamed protein product [Didymodactylos carnosus]CAF3577174.1 unnamed protein product [Didymodactylos carnosus]CAF3580452.1 unnamed protein product [Didymodactylos carnosus]